MRRTLACFALLLGISALPAVAQTPEAAVAAQAERAAPAPTITTESAQQPVLEPVQARSVATDQPASAAQFQRGSFLWYVGIIVVAGVVLALLLN